MRENRSQQLSSVSRDWQMARGGREKGMASRNVFSTVSTTLSIASAAARSKGISGRDGSRRDGKSESRRRCLRRRLHGATVCSRMHLQLRVTLALIFQETFFSPCNAMRCKPQPSHTLRNRRRRTPACCAACKRSQKGECSPRGCDDDDDDDVEPATRTLSPGNFRVPGI